ncbi:copper resistance CopC family protein [Micromonospora craniellae]|uniref:Copper resistance protein CopC n=1 Tax=Micromonospora craniellae TaxID=2294034 RepID=A0A372FTE2_9ACTN|nr:copper resistance CopC family protein [Micromonospora craniellae]QOC93954.1 copper resistance protein CopC [Micromonospora craniellae]RFS44021.1 copper resistance protein CopC [Micromonospora craniellae]
MSTRLRHRVTAALAASLLAATALLATPASPAYAHNVLTKATPAQDAELTKAPTKVTLQFLQRLNPDYTTITLSDADKAKVATSEAEVDGTKGTITIDTPLVNGTYTVAYRIVSADGHPVQGSYQFTVADPTATAEPTPTLSPTPSPEPTEAAPSAEPTVSASPAASGADDDSTPVGLLVGAGVLIVLAAGAAGFLLRRRRTAGQ